MRYLARKANQKFEKAFGQNPHTRPKPESEGSISIDKMPSSETKSNTTVGDYVDYEEID